MSKKKICFCALSAYPLLNPSANIEFSGGAETQQLLIAREFAKKGIDVNFIVFDHGQKEIEEIDGIKIFKTINPKKISSNIKSVLISLKNIFSVLNKIDSNVYFQQCGNIFTGFFAFYCKLKQKKFVFQLASDMELDLKKMDYLKFYEKVSYLFGLKIADFVIAQTEHQKKILKDHFNVDSHIVRNPVTIKENEESDDVKRDTILWVGTVKSSWKQPDLFLNLAKAIPQANFLLIGGPSKEIEYYRKMEKLAEKIPNLELTGHVPYALMNDYYKKGLMLVNTSIVEGFPNTFLEAWSHGLPVVSLNVDSDNMIRKYRLGLVSNTFNNLVKDVSNLYENDSKRLKIGRNAKKIVKETFSSTNIANEYIKVIF